MSILLCPFHPVTTLYTSWLMLFAALSYFRWGLFYQLELFSTLIKNQAYLYFVLYRTLNYYLPLLCTTLSSYRQGFSQNCTYTFCVQAATYILYCIICCFFLLYTRLLYKAVQQTFCEQATYIFIPVLYASLFSYRRGYCRAGCRWCQSTWPHYPHDSQGYSARNTELEIILSNSYLTTRGNFLDWISYNLANLLKMIMYSLMWTNYTRPLSLFPNAAKMQGVPISSLFS